LAGKRTVPIEVGSKYTDESWSQKLMTIEEFIHKFILTNADNSTKTNNPSRGYLAQHPLFDQVNLTVDIYILNKIKKNRKAKLL
jgi:[protein]-arginine 3-hydroxylase / protease